MKAFPSEGKVEYKLIGNNWVVDKEQGMDLRDYFAAKAMQSIITDGKLGLTLIHEKYIKTVSEMSYEYADAMMEARK